MFDKDMSIRGKYATYWKALSQIPGNANDTSHNFKIFENYITTYMVAPIIGLLYGKRCFYDPLDVNKDTAGMLAEVQIKNSSKLKYIYRLLVLTDDSLGLTSEEKINLAFRELDNPEYIKKGMDLYTSYFFGGLEVLYETFVMNCITDDDYIAKMFEFVSNFKEEQSIDEISVDIEKLLRK
ncbi:MAG: hypothetical protein IJT36_06295 [Alphaproteobacteria bacterium]|nr:hypothetical protein [Alphaproteobacteria bacterium]